MPADSHLAIAVLWSPRMSRDLDLVAIQTLDGHLHDQILLAAYVPEEQE